MTVFAFFIHFLLCMIIYKFYFNKNVYHNFTLKCSWFATLHCWLPICRAYFDISVSSSYCHTKMIDAKIFFLRSCGKYSLFFPRMTIQAICLTGQISSSMCLCLTGIFPTQQYVSVQLIFYHRLFWWKEEHKGKEEESRLRICADFTFNPTLTCTYICWLANTSTLTCWGILASGDRANS